MAKGTNIGPVWFRRQIQEKLAMDIVLLWPCERDAGGRFKFNL